MPALADHPLSELPPHLFDGRRWSLTQFGTAVDQYKLFFVHPSTKHKSYWELSMLGCEGLLSLSKPTTPRGVSLILGLWGLSPESTAWVPDDQPVREVNTHLPHLSTIPSVYFAKTEDAPFVKIGWAKDVARRLPELQVGCPYRLFVAATVPGSLADEAAFHRRFAAYRVRPDGEWFRCEGGLLTFIATVSPTKESPQ